MAVSRWYSHMVAIAQHRRDIEEASAEFEAGINLQTHAQKGMTPLQYMREIAKEHRVSVVEMKLELDIIPTDEDWIEHEKFYTIVIPLDENETP